MPRRPARVSLTFTLPDCSVSIKLLRVRDFPAHSSVSAVRAIVVSEMTPSQEPSPRNFMGVYRGQATVNLKGRRLQVVLKMSKGVAQGRTLLRREAERYKHVSTLQGHIVPRFYGLFEGVIDGRRGSCLLLEYCGAPILEPMCSLSDKQKVAVLEQLYKLHRAGIWHNDLAPRNIVWKDDCTPVFIDLELSKAHTCSCEMIAVAPQSLAPSQREFGCAEIYDLVDEMKLKDWVMFNSLPLPIWRIFGIDDLIRLGIDLGIRQRLPTWRVERVLEDAKKVWQYIEWRRRELPHRCELEKMKTKGEDMRLPSQPLFGPSALR